MRHLILNLLLTVTIFFTGLDALVSGKTIDQDSVKYHFKPVVVTGQRYKMSQQDMAASITIIEGAALRHTNLETVMDAIAYMAPGVFTTRKSNIGYGVSTLAAGGVTIRGLGGVPNSQVLVLIDGRPDFQGIFSHPISDAYPLDHIDHIEVLRGPASVVYGTNALGGVVNIITKDMEKISSSSQLKVQYGSYNTQRYVLQDTRNFGKLKYFLSLAHQQSDGHRDRSKFYGQHYALKLGYRVNRHIDINLNGSVTPYRFNDPGPEGIDLRGYFEQGDITRSSVDFTISNTYSNSDGIIKIHGNFGEHDLSDGWYSEDQTNGILAYQNFKLKYDIQTTVGLDVKRFGGTSESNGAKLGTFFNDEVASYVHIQKEFIRRLIIDTGIRFENNSNFGWERIPRAGIVYRGTPNTSFRASASKGFRSPSIRDFFLFNPANNKLKPEKLANYELGLNSMFAPGYSIDVSMFYYEGDQLIETNVLGPGIILNQNSGQNSVRGFEITLNAHPLDHLHAFLSYSYMDSDKDLPFSPNKFNYWVNYSIRKIEATLYGEVVDHLWSSYQLDQLPPRSTIERMPDYGLIHLKMHYLLTDKLRIGLGLENLLDEDYSIMKGYPMPGRNYNMHVSFEF
ncbi:TonB-dependent receptor [candidate division KSB1 bacterium]|nr:TonB-dependent receptor [candidate division KSB1 bacterium]